MIRELLENKSVVRVEDANGEKILVWENTIKPSKTHMNYKTYLNVLLGNINNVNGQKQYLSFDSIVPIIKELYSNIVDKEEYGNKDIEFKMADFERKKEMIRELLENEGVILIKESESTLVWVKSISPNRKYQEYKTHLNTLLGIVTDVNGQRNYSTFESIVPVIKKLYEDIAEKEKYENKDIEFEMANLDKKKEMFRNLIESEGVVKIEEFDGINTLVWNKTINAQNKYGDYKSRLNQLLGNITEVDGSKHYTSFRNIINVINKLYDNIVDSVIELE